ncbi:DUF4913 domain-containing protein [Actinopolyspora halophila]|uniref:DUF4913 domain-containing protein n=1 Tax=Actinopolyspora halophila TaxID=1850 RepID=UPI0003821822|nr:DUF4913 domain-containing protein [Actinopolyspora halophila]
MTGHDDEWDEAFHHDEDEQNPQQQPLYPSVEEWVNGWLAPMIRRPLGTTAAWCPHWWAHPEAVARLEALWRCWEAARLDGPMAMSTWWLQHADPHLALLTDPDRSPFASCHDGHRDELAPLPTEPAPAGWWGETDHDGQTTAAGDPEL